jgi:hypothetical protein
MHIFLILYLWHGDSSGNSSIGGPSISVSAMPSVAVCEQVGAATKRLADEQIKAAARPSQCDGFLRDTSGFCSSRPAVFRCITAGPTK